MEEMHMTNQTHESVSEEEYSPKQHHLYCMNI